MAAIELRGVAKHYGSQTIIHDFNCTIAAGEFVVIVGPSGCGKSTLLRLIAGLEILSAGDIFIGGRCVNQREPAERDIAMVFQNYALYPHMTVYNNMAYGLRIRGLDKATIDRRVRQVAAILALPAELLTRLPRQLSGGQRQRVAMGRAIVREPAAFLFDEPLSNLDAQLRVQMRLEIKKLHAELKTTSIYVTHDQVEAMTLGQRLIVMNAGRAEQIGTPLDVYQYPRTLFVAGFIGAPAMNIISGHSSADGLSVRLGNGTELPLQHAVPGNRAVQIGLRPEHLRLDAASSRFAIRAELHEPLGADTLVHGFLAQTSLTVRLPGIRHIAAGEVLPLAVLPEHIHVFDSASGERLDGSDQTKS